MGTAASVSATSIRSRLEQEVENENEITDAQAAELEALYKSLVAATDGTAEGDRANVEEDAYAAVKANYCEFVAKETNVALRGLPDAIDAAVFVEAKWPLIVDPTGQAARFLQYQNGAFVVASIPAAVEAAALRPRLVSCLENGRNFVLSFGTQDPDINALFQEGLFPEALLRQEQIFQEEVYKTLLRQDAGDPEPHLFFPSSDFKFIVVTSNPCPPMLRTHFAVIVVDGAKANGTNGEGGAEGSDAKSDNDPLSAMFGATKEVIRMSEALVEAAFDGDMEEVQAQLDKGFHPESCDEHEQTALSEASCQGHDAVVTLLLGLGADPNSKSDTGRTPLMRAAFNGHQSTVQLLLSAGADPDEKMTKSGESCFDIAADDATRALIEGWDRQLTTSKKAEREKILQAKLEERIKSSAEREFLAKQALKEELLRLTADGEVAELKSRLEEVVDEAQMAGARPRATVVSTRDKRGNTLLSVAAWKNQLQVAELLLTHHLSLGDEFGAKAITGTDENKVARSVWRVQPNCRDQKGFTPVAIAAFHNHASMVELLLKHGADPTLKNAYGKDALAMAQSSRADSSVAIRWFDSKLQAQDKAHNSALETDSEKVIATWLTANKQSGATICALESDLDAFQTSEYKEGMDGASKQTAGSKSAGGSKKKKVGSKTGKTSKTVKTTNKGTKTKKKKKTK